MVYSNTVVDIFMSRAKAEPGNLALISGEIVLTYKQLDERSNQLANYLITNGLKQGALVPVCTSRLQDMVIGIWGILKAGCAYVPVDPEFPIDRIKYMIEDTAANVVISDSRTTSFLTAAEGKDIILSDNDWTIINDSSAAPTGLTIPVNSVAYVIYTSGSTGQPKGVLIEHRSLVHYLQGLHSRFPYHSCRTFALGISFATDLGNTNFFGALVLGSALHLFTKEEFNNIEFIHQYFKTNEIDCLKIVPSHWKSLSFNGADLLPKKILMFGGEALYVSVIKNALADPSRECILLNHYGPTETTIGQLAHQIQEDHTYNHIIPIGTPFTDATIHLLDEEGNEVAGDAHGEIYIGGSCVTRGYLNKPELTAQRFIKDKFSTDKNARLYRTGDLARKLADGNIEYLGRIDDQVKIRGYRIEC